MTSAPFTAQSLYGVAAEFDTPEKLLAAAKAASCAGFTHVEGYSPFIVEGVAESLGHRPHPVALITLVAGMMGALSGFGMCWYANVISYPLNIGGRPHNSWPAWIPITFEMTVLFAALSAAIGMLMLNGLPRLHHPAFEIPNFARASTDRFFLCVEATDPRFDVPALRALLQAHDPLAISEVPA